MGPMLVFGFLVLSGIFYYNKKKSERIHNEILRIKSLDLESKKFEFMKLQKQHSDAKVNHLLHFFLSIFTVGFWVIPWILISSSASKQRNQIDEIIEKI